MPIAILPKKMRYLHLIGALLFIVFAGVQLNDPDPLLWICIYFSVAVVCILGFYTRYFPKLTFTLALVFLGYSLWFIPGVKEWLMQDNRAQLFDNVAKMEHPFIEESREFLGLWIAAATLFFYAHRGRAPKS